MNARKCRTIRLGESLVVVLPKDWTRGNDLGPGDELSVEYNGLVKFRLPKPRPERPKIMQEGDSVRRD
jgi:antitoxin component of MazEF toxin-antitoxin module